jgi:hypothetical protein
MTKGGPKPLRAYFPGGLTNATSRHAGESARLKNAWHSHIPAPLASHAHPVRYADGVLYVHVDTPAWASRMRQQVAALMTSLRRDSAMRDLKEIRTRVVPLDPDGRAGVSQQSPSRLSAGAAAQIARAADDVTDPQLREALKRLARRAEGKPSKRRS